VSKTRKTSFLVLLTVFWTPAQAQESNDIIQALRQQREEALDKVANAYVTIMKLQRELDRIKAEKAAPQGLNAPPPPK
jgi:hypothetical protein